MTWSPSSNLPLSRGRSYADLPGGQDKPAKERMRGLRRAHLRCGKRGLGTPTPRERCGLVLSSPLPTAISFAYPK
jgi:hypothetical protein